MGAHWAAEHAPLVFGLGLLGMTGYMAFARRQQRHGAVERAPVDQAALLGEVAANWSKPLCTTPVAIDLPRLASKMTIRRDGVVMFGPTQRSSDRVQLVQELLVTLAVALGLNQVAKRLDRSVFPESQDMLPRRLQPILQSLLPEGQPLIDVLKCCTQAILAPPAIALKRMLASTLQYKDMRGCWEIDINVNGPEVVVVHSKREISWDCHVQEPKNGPVVRLHWTLSLYLGKFARDLERLQLRVTDVDCSSAVDLQHQEDLHVVLDELMNPDMMMTTISDES